MLMFEDRLMDNKKDQILNDTENWTVCTDDYQHMLLYAFEETNGERLDYVEVDKWPEGVSWTEGEDYVQTTVKGGAPYRASLQGLAQEVLQLGERGTRFALERLLVLKHKKGRRFFVMVKFRHEKLKKK